MIGTSRIVALDHALDEYDLALQKFIKTDRSAADLKAKKADLSHKYDAVCSAYIKYITAKHDDKGHKIAAGADLKSLAAGGNSALESKKRNHRMSAEYRDEDCAGGKKNFDLEAYISAMEQQEELLKTQPKQARMAQFRKDIYNYFKSIRKDGDGDHVFQRLAKELLVEGDLLTNGWYDTDGGTAQKSAEKARLVLLQETFTNGARFVPKAEWKAQRRAAQKPTGFAGRVEDIAMQIVDSLPGVAELGQLKEGMKGAYRRNVSAGTRADIDYAAREVQGMSGIMWEVVTGVVEFAKSLCEEIGDEGFKEICISIVGEGCGEAMKTAAPFVGMTVDGLKLGRKIAEIVKQAKNEKLARFSERYVSGELTKAWQSVTDMFNDAKKDAIWESVGAATGALGGIAELAFPGIGTVVAKAVNLAAKIGLIIKQIMDAFKNFHAIKKVNHLIVHEIQGSKKLDVKLYDEVFETMPLAGAYVIAQAKPIHLIASYAYLQAPGGIDIGPYFKSIWQPMCQVKSAAAELILSNSFVLVPGVDKLAEEDKTIQAAIQKLCGGLSTAGDWLDRFSALSAA